MGHVVTLMWQYTLMYTHPYMFKSMLSLPYNERKKKFLKQTISKQTAIETEPSATKMEYAD